jgi:hypothetical protein
MAGKVDTADKRSAYLAAGREAEEDKAVVAVAVDRLAKRIETDKRT